MPESVRYVVDASLNILVTVVALSSLVLWIRWGLARSRGRVSIDTIVPARPRDRPFWSFADALVMFGAHFAILMAAQAWWMPARRGSVPEQVASSVDTYLAGTVMLLISATASGAITWAWLRLLDPNPIRNLGLVVSGRDLRLGLKASVVVLPPVLLISGFVNRFFEYEHEVLNQLKEVESLGLFSLMFLSTAIVTPIFEEVLFRGLVQGGLQGVVDGASETPGHWRPSAYWPIWIASLVFALMHLGQGAAPIPLFFLSLGLGYLYRQTGNLTAPIVVHMVLNGLTMITLFTGTVES